MPGTEEASVNSCGMGLFTSRFLIANPHPQKLAQTNSLTLFSSSVREEESMHKPPIDMADFNERLEAEIESS